MEENSDKDYVSFHEMGLDDRILKVCLFTEATNARKVDIDGISRFGCR